MIYFSNVAVDTPHMTFVGRWTPFHKGHVAIINKKRVEKPGLPVLILVRSTNFDAYSPAVRAEMIKKWMENESVAGTIMIIPDVEGVYWGRGVGYKLEEVVVEDELQAISATRIRKGIAKEMDHDWQTDVASKEAAGMALPVVSRIIEKGKVVWLTGCPSSGKSTITQELERRIGERLPFLKVQVLDGDVMRSSPLAQEVGYSKAERAAHILRMGQLAKMFADHGILVIAAFVSPDGEVRSKVKEMVGKERFVEVYVSASKTVRIARDVKGLYQKAINGEIDNLTGFNAVYERPKHPEIICKTDQESVGESVEKVFEKVFS